MGAQMVREVASKTNDIAGDGTTTATVLAPAIVREGAKSVAAGMNPMDLKRGIDRRSKAVVEGPQKAPRRSPQREIAQVGTISANGDAAIGKMIAEAMQKVGNEGVITVEEAKSLETELDVVEGMQFDRGYSRPTSSPTPTRWSPSSRTLHPHPREEALLACSRCCRCSKPWCRPAAAADRRRRRRGEALATWSSTSCAAA